jgi:hypothetical protein
VIPIDIDFFVKCALQGFFPLSWNQGVFARVRIVDSETLYIEFLPEEAVAQMDDVRVAHFNWWKHKEISIELEVEFDKRRVTFERKGLLVLTLDLTAVPP